MGAPARNAARRSGHAGRLDARGAGRRRLPRTVEPDSGLRPWTSREQASSIEQIGHQKRAQAAAERALTISRQARREHHQSQPVDVTVGVEQSRRVEL